MTTRDLALMSAGAIIGSGLTFFFVDHLFNRRSCRQKEQAEHTDQASSPPQELPPFAQALESDMSLHRILLREWEDVKWRDRNGWHGRDLCHNPDGQAVRVLAYYYNDSLTELTGVVWFGPHAESHRGLCHGGAMSSLMDDFAGHVAFVSSKAPWSGATVQVNVSLKKPVPIGSVLRIVGRVSKRERRKVHVEAVLDDGGDVVYAALEGLSIDDVKMSHHDDDIAFRKWEVDKCPAGRLQRRDSGWKLQ